MRELVKKYLHQRVLFYTTRDTARLAKSNADTTELQNEMWSAVRLGVGAQLDAVRALAISGMNEVLNWQG